MTTCFLFRGATRLDEIPGSLAALAPGMTNNNQIARRPLSRAFQPAAASSILFQLVSALNPVDPVSNEDAGRNFDAIHCSHEDLAMPTLVLRETIPSGAKAPAISSRSTSETRRSATKPSDRSLEGVLIFSGLGFGLMVLAAIFNMLELPPPIF